MDIEGISKQGFFNAFVSAGPAWIFAAKSLYEAKDASKCLQELRRTNASEIFYAGKNRTALFLRKERRFALFNFGFALAWQIVRNFAFTSPANYDSVATEPQKKQAKWAAALSGGAGLFAAYGFFSKRLNLQLLNLVLYSSNYFANVLGYIGSRVYDSAGAERKPAEVQLQPTLPISTGISIKQ